MNRIFEIVVLLLLVTSAGALAQEREVYRWTDSDGEVHYADRPQSDTAQRLDIATAATDNARINQERQALLERKQERQAARAETAKTENEAAAESERRIENCRRARAALASIVNARRLYEPADDGSRRYLDAAEIAQRRSQAQDDVAEWCN